VWRDAGYSIRVIALGIDRLEVAYPDRDLSYPVDPRLEAPAAESYLGVERWDAAGTPLVTDEGLKSQLRRLERRLKAEEDTLRHLEAAEHVTSPTPRADNRVVLQTAQTAFAAVLELRVRFGELL
jgi:hypothetical protein